MPRYAGLALLLLLISVAGTVRAQDLEEFEERVTEFTLENGLTFIVVERHIAPVVSFYTYADVGSVDEVTGLTGMAHMFEHMAFKGTTTIGTTDIEAERAAMERADELMRELRRERLKGPLADADRVAELEQQFREAEDEAESYIVEDEYVSVIEREGGVGLNAGTGADLTVYFYSLPSNKVELWFSLESDRFLNPVLREFYTEVDVVMEERRMRTENQPVGRLVEEFVTTSFKAHPYGEPVIGHMSDIQNLTRPQAYEFFEQYYGANNLTIAIVGSVDPDEILELAESYFGRLPERPDPEPVVTREPPQLGQRRVIVSDHAQPFLLMGYHKGSIHHGDEEVFTVMADILGRGRTSRLYRGLILDRQVAADVGAFTGFPGRKYPNMFVFNALPVQGHTASDLEDAILEEVERLQDETVTEEELERAKTRARADLIRQLGSNSGLAGQLASYQALTGDWRNLFHRLERIDAVTAEDVQRVAREYLDPERRNVSFIETRTPGL